MNSASVLFWCNTDYFFKIAVKRTLRFKTRGEIHLGYIHLFFLKHFCSSAYSVLVEKLFK